MSRLQLTFACCRYDRMEAIREGSVVPEGVELNCLTLGSGREVFDRMKVSCRRNTAYRSWD